MAIRLDPAITAVAVGVGTDLLAVSRIEAVLERTGERFVRRILTAAERELWQQRRGSANFLAKQFAAKEAIAKALGTGIGAGVSFQQMEVLRSAAGAPEVRLSGAAAAHLARLGGEQVLLSLSDDNGLILAFAVLSRR